MHYYTSYCEYCGVGQIWMQVAVLHCAWLTRIHIEYLDVQDRQVISACTAAEGDVWSVLPLFCILSASGKSTNHSRPPLPVLWWASDQMFWYLGWIGLRWEVATMDSLLAAVDATLSTCCWLWCGQPLPIPTDQHHAALWLEKTVLPHQPLVICSCRLGLHIRTWCQGGH